MKSARNEYKEKPFYFTEIFEGSPRTIAWDESTENQKDIFFGLLSLLEERIDYLFKEDTDDTNEKDRWIRISGGIYKSDLIDLITLHEKWFFNDSVFQFCFREPDGTDYVAYDEHGLFYIYGLPQSEDILKKYGLQYRNSELISDKAHWQVRPKDSEKDLETFKVQLKLKSVFYDDEAEPAASEDG